MGNSKKPNKDKELWASVLAPRLLLPLQRLLDEQRITADQCAIAVSGGPDSALLAVLLSHLVPTESRTRPHIIHVHHGLQAAADDWCYRVHALGTLLGMPSHSVYVRVALDEGRGVEAAARQARYVALRRTLRSLGLRYLLLAHHQDDQAETVLLRLLRGSGPGGLAAMAAVSERDGLAYLRPWLDVSRADILQAMQAFSMLYHWWPVYDPTNYDDAYTRSALRERLTPALNQRWPGWQRMLSRHAQLAAQNHEILAEVGQADLDSLSPDALDGSFCLQAWRKLSMARQAHVLRHWLHIQGCRAPTQARLNEMLRQLRQVHALGHDRQLRIRHDAAWLVCRRGRVILERSHESSQKALK